MTKQMRWQKIKKTVNPKRFASRFRVKSTSYTTLPAISTRTSTSTLLATNTATAALLSTVNICTSVIATLDADPIIQYGETLLSWQVHNKIFQQSIWKLIRFLISMLNFASSKILIWFDKRCWIKLANKFLHKKIIQNEKHEVYEEMKSQL